MKFRSSIAILALSALSSQATFAQAPRELFYRDINMRNNMYDILPSRYVRQIVGSFSITFNCQLKKTTLPSGYTRLAAQECRAIVVPEQKMELDQAFVADSAKRGFFINPRIPEGPIRFTFNCWLDGGGEMVCGMKSK